MPLARTIHAQEQPDPTFNAGFWTPGWQSAYFINSTAINEEAKAIARTGDGSYIVAGRVPDPNSFVGVDIGLVKYKSDGTLDTSFGGIANVHGSAVPATPGKVLWDAFQTDVTDMTLDSQGRIVVVGPAPAGPGGDSDFGVVRFLADGSDVDRSFNNGVGGMFVGFNLGGDNNDIPVQVLTDAQDRIVVLGNISEGTGSCSFRRSIGMTRVNINGVVDASFGNHSPRDGRMDACVGLGTDGFAAGFTFFDNGGQWGSLYAIASTFGSATQTAMALVFVDVNGDLAQSSSELDIPTPGGINSVRASAVVLQSSSQLIIAGNALNNNIPSSAIVCRVYATTQNGGDILFDPAFGPNCYVSPDSDSAVNSIAIHSDRSVELVGDYVAPPSFFRGTTTTLRPDGTSPPNSMGLWHAPRVFQPDLSFRTSFARVILDHDRPVIVGYRADNSNIDSDHDFVMLRLRTDLIFANDFQ